MNETQDECNAIPESAQTDNVFISSGRETMGLANLLSIKIKVTQ